MKLIEFVSDQSKIRKEIFNRAYNVISKDIEKKSFSNEDKDIIKTIKEILNESKITNSVNASVDSFIITPQEIHWMDKNNESRWSDYLIHRYKFRYAKKLQKVSDFPPYLLIEPTSICNLRCVMCFQVDETFSKNKSLMGLMSWELFTSVVDQAHENKCQAITLASRGEPTLHKKFIEMVHYIGDKKFLDTKINTNATRLNEKMTHAILESEISNVTFSVDATDAESYEKIRVGGKFDKVLENINSFNEIREKFYPNSQTTTRVSGVAVDPEQNPEKMEEFWSKYIDEVAIVPNLPRWDSYNNPRFMSSKVCNILYERMYVWWDGICNPCDFDYKSLLKVGDANKNTLKEIWHGEKFSLYRKLHESKKRSTINPCDRCPI